MCLLHTFWGVETGAPPGGSTRVSHSSLPGTPSVNAEQRPFGKRFCGAEASGKAKGQGRERAKSHVRCYLPADYNSLSGKDLSQALSPALYPGMPQADRRGTKVNLSPPKISRVAGPAPSCHCELGPVHFLWGQREKGKQK